MSTIEQLEKRIAALEATIGRVAGAFGGSSSSSSSGGGRGEVAPDSELDSKFGDPEIKRDPSAKYWEGASFIGKKYSRCSADYLDAMAKYKDACAYANEKEANPDKAKFIEYDRKDAARARGWAARVREQGPRTNGCAAPKPSDSGNGSVPF